VTPGETPKGPGDYAKAAYGAITAIGAVIMAVNGACALWDRLSKKTDPEAEAKKQKAVAEVFAAANAEALGAAVEAAAAKAAKEEVQARIDEILG